MSKEHKICKNTIEKLINSNEPFSYKEACEKVIENGGFLRTSPGTTLGEYLVTLQEMEIIQYEFIGNEMYFKNAA